MTFDICILKPSKKEVSIMTSLNEVQAKMRNWISESEMLKLRNLRGELMDLLRPHIAMDYHSGMYTPKKLIKNGVENYESFTL